MSLTTSCETSRIPLRLTSAVFGCQWNATDFWKQVLAESGRGVDGNIICFKLPMANNDTKWSYARTDEQGFVSEVQEKKVISENATVGVYYWSRGCDYVKMADTMIAKNIRVNNEVG